MEWKNIFRGLVMGISDLIPGVSGGTIAVVLGIYDRLLEAISGFFSREWKRYIGFLLPLGMGIGLALLLLSRLIQYLLDEHFMPTQFFFIGLLLGVIPYLVKRADAKHNFTFKHWIVLLIAGALIASMAFTNSDKSGEPMTSLSLLSAVGLFFSGWLASMAMLLPGISGSFILLLLGVYPTAIHALSTLNIPFIAIIGAGVAVGFIVSSKFIRYLLAQFPYMMYAIIIGLILGSTFVIFPGFANNLVTMVISIITFALGLTLTALFSTKNKD
ncbi:DUF368 domain-containing protein [Desmospora activa]|uniref:Putative membrane protein n=1 Tax=Desmospora activa DSM 45169 TaxID=1121389 RepID=A0A2T4ZC01_9BACL|nr:DUF368 domain-containing protein [Desmospora activa]PTM59424.1 putative membrane protein [Desmospora activa DSM 45169]